LAINLRLGEGEMRSGGFRRPSILADALEAVVRRGFPRWRIWAGEKRLSCVFTILFSPESIRSRSGKDPKTALQEHLQGRHMALPQYHLKATHGEAHAHEFEVECLIPELGIATIGRGPSRRSAEQEAARQALAQTGSK
jgi:ribonuclease-3